MSNFNILKTDIVISDIFEIYAVWVIFGVCIIHQILTWTTESLTWIILYVYIYICGIFACVYAWGTSDTSLIQRTFVECAQNLTPEKS